MKVLTQENETIVDDLEVEDTTEEETTISEEAGTEEEKEIQQLQDKIEELKIMAQRTQADFMNYKKRVEREKEQISVLANEKIMEELIPVIDNFSRALEACSEDDKKSQMFAGVEMIMKQLTDTLGKFGLSEIETLGAEFDPMVHHAVMQDDGQEPNKILEVFQKGYKLKEKVIRPAMVKVSK